jgi:hypothetical protein
MSHCRASGFAALGENKTEMNIGPLLLNLDLKQTLDVHAHISSVLAPPRRRLE